MKWCQHVKTVSCTELHLNLDAILVVIIFSLEKTERKWRDVTMLEWMMDGLTNERMSE